VVVGTGVGMVVLVMVTVATGAGVVRETVVPPTAKVRILESGAWLSKEAGSRHFAWML
jgi:hypothetical protein